ncbi:MAG: HAD family hydrolase [Candidatus Kerfeldbacteria bacterium RIFCSPLOWO2_01_FULL_48_11]|uniref:HAD family hydrolase n=1 Tax=Candidatus Kerfeldbacteria bacterium RIFCSPLOWO2_01_FULL_48_11 TaxID=1798543 RepID=A0A1G2B208_9BACT|nr:MAG: Metal dependent phosphohydrolase [Parcubacteria group bacterium GW2011_GWA2_48_9]KKW16216.1 MAG: Metal dependent phosphohydrolase [Parcubacteria group bacterium GW2011_GWC2_49_9]OGY82786.1 MAG: HAD family hydrolase [Candidatus Kerfeldbacteria bacterium RIFCSPLOWO2_01_FULL_48_11]HCJ52663.1 HAD family hydrolase [Candidatus Kerfeldbacteria bacterium]
MTPSRSEAWKLLNEFTKSPSLIKHMIAVEAAMRAYAKKFNADQDWWGIVGLLHDFDYERYPDLKDHPFQGAEVLRKHKYPEGIIHAILAHAPHTGEPRDSLAKKAIYAVDELCGFIVAVTLVRPSKHLSDVSVESVKKKMKDKAFARQVSREDIVQGAEELEMPLNDHIATVLLSMQGVASELGL